MVKFSLLLTFSAVASSVLAISKPVEVTVDQLVSSPKQFNGKDISVTGYFDTTVHHGCDLRAQKRRPDDGRQYINIVVPEQSLPEVKRLTHNFTRVVRARVVGTFQYRYVGFVGKERPVSGDPNVKIRQFQSGFGWMGNWDKQITNITELRVIAE
jgi:hypothetical protein